MNVFRITGDWFHFAALILLFAKIFYKKSCVGISGRSQLLFAIVYLSRYSDMWLNSVFYSTYNTVMKLFFINSAIIIVLMIFGLYRRTYEQEKDRFPTEILLFLCFVSAVIFNYDIRVPTEILWAFSIYLEAVAIIPQFHMILKSQQIEKIILYYLVALGLYRTMYIANWAYRYNDEGYYDSIAISGGVVYTLVYVIAAIGCCCAGVKITDEGRQSRLRDNIFFISSNEPLYTAALYDQMCAEKNASIDIPQKA